MARGLSDQHVQTFDPVRHAPAEDPVDLRDLPVRLAGTQVLSWSPPVGSTVSGSCARRSLHEGHQPLRLQRRIAEFRRGR